MRIVTAGTAAYAVSSMRLAKMKRMTYDDELFALLHGHSRYWANAKYGGN